MKVEVLKKFKDKETGKIHKKGEVFDCTEERYEEIVKVNPHLVRVLEDAESKDDEQDPETKMNESISGSGTMCDIAHGQERVTGNLDEGDLEKMDYSNLKKLAKDMGLSAKGSKEELVKKITAKQVEISNGEGTV